ncbi:UbiA prenyltransferase family protein [Anaeromyxobacter oryzae]|uniref:UbiA prenyltransferase n=1 Tax=Anaeromyxobacter oryzae TaxID=2918170 RepID=A0ABM7WP84_9BACT|nr:hypothetical protein [Anaeromyxobacter oryzae]BDG01289.1 hypothetical protein AMOR_02850 [Anaeromyxobacter oryzae]
MSGASTLPGRPAAARSGAARLGRYLATRFGPSEAGATAVLSLAAQLGAAALAGARPLPLSGAVAAATASSVLLALYLRLSDDLKDWDTDRRLASAGDARFADRPHVTGEIAAAELRRARVGVAALFGLLLGAQPPAVAALGGACFVGAWLSARWFFHPAMARDLILAFVTHNPLALLFLAFAAAAGAAAAGARPAPGATLALVGGLYLPVAAWEIARKVRVPSEETAYETWSARAGFQTAGALPAALAVASSVLLAAAGRAAALGPAYAALLAAAAAPPVIAAGLLLRAPSPAGARRLRPAVEAHALAAALGLVLAAARARGVALLP